MSIEGLKIAREIMRQKALRPFVLAERLPGPDKVCNADLIEFGCQNAKTDHHPVGTCRMGHDDLAVVTPDLRVRGVAALRVCDASIMPKIVSSNTNAPTIMIGEKASDLVRGLDPLTPVLFSTNRIGA
jgi:choline dehydrogenase-like flavoprotein